MIGRIKDFESLKGFGIIATLSDAELPVQSRNVNMNGAVVLHKNDVVEYELGTDDNGKPQAVNVYLIVKAKYAVELSKLSFADFGLDENHVAVSMTFDALSELLLMTKTHYESWLTAWYLSQTHSGRRQTPQPHKDQNPPPQASPSFQSNQNAPEYTGMRMF